MTPRPPRLAQAFLARLVPPGDRDAVLGDLAEEFAARVARDGRTSARRWYWRQLKRSTGPTLAERTRDLGTRGPMAPFRGSLRDLRDAARALRAAPSFTVAALLILALSTGAGTAIYTVVDAVVLRGLPFDDANRIVALKTTNRLGESDNAPPDFLDWRARQDAFVGMAGTLSPTSVALDTASRDARRVRVLATTHELFSVLGVRPQLGQTFGRANEIEANRHVVVLSDAFWHEQFAADPDIVGRPLRLSNGVWEIVGVMPPGFTYPLGTAPIDLWVPYVMAPREDLRLPTHNSYVGVIARLKPDVTLGQARRRMTQLLASMSTQDPGWFKGRGVEVLTLKEATVGSAVELWMLLLLGAVGSVLLIACVNLANLLLARSTVRARDLGIRAALGASRWQLARGLLIESLLLSSLGTCLGVAFAYIGVEGLRASLPPGLFRGDLIAVNLRVLTASVCAAVATGLVMGVAPALNGSRGRVTGALREGGRGGTPSVARQRVRTALVVAELTLAVPLIVGAGLFVVSFARLMQIDVGVDYHHVLTQAVTPHLMPPVAPRQAPDLAADQPIPPDRARAAADLAEMADRVRALPGVVSAAALEVGVPLLGVEFRTNITVPGRVVEESEGIRVFHVTRDYPTTMRIPLLRGRWFTSSEDRANGAPVVLLNDLAVRRFLADRDPLGTTVGIQGNRTVVGIVGATRIGGPEGDLHPEAYIPMAQVGVRSGYLVFRTDELPSALAAPIAGIVSQVAADAKVGTLQALDDVFAQLVAERRLSMWLFGLFGLLAVAIASVGIYGVVAYLVEQRTREIGVRLALGATPARILRLVMGRSAIVIAVGVSLGAGATWALARFVAAFLFRVPAHDVGIYLSLSGLLVAIGLLASVIPARRAARVDPLEALRAE
jgi:putative ABC transport system permease protein